MKKSPRAIARARGLTTYFTGKPCLRGHIAKRWTGNGVCQTCFKAIGRRYFKTPKGREARVRDRNGVLGRERQWRYERTPKGRETSRRYARSPKGLERGRFKT